MTMQAIDLFGGIDQVLNKMSEAVREKLKQKSWAELERIEDALGLRRLTLSEILKGSRPVDYLFFEAISPLLDLTVDQILGEPELNNAQSEYWTRQMKESPLLLVGGMGGVPASKECFPVALYVIQRAIEELNCTAMSNSTDGGSAGASSQ